MPRRQIPALAERTIRCILFDLGDTLWSRKDLAVWQRMEYDANDRAVALLRTCTDASRLPELDDTALGKRFRKSVEKHLRTLVRQNLELEPEGAVAVAHALQQWGIENVDYQQSAAIFEGLRVRIPGSRPLFDDVLSTLAELQRRGFQLGVVTNRHWGGAIFQEDLQTLGLLDYFDPRHMAISIDLGIRKPNPAIFLHVLRALDIPPQEAAMVGDSLRSDILGAQLLGLFTIWKPSPALGSEVYARKAAASAAGATSSVLSSLTTEANSEERPADLPPGMHITDDDYVLAHIQSRVGKWDEHMQRDIKPDVRIDTLSDLLNIFVEAGEQ
ncbi:MAG TPA: HAD-IA family hydrolase [Ktedonobacteraceae bacterium]|nr:HAD-IA family hydrolase [Ktedonobacteraceae bacterium]